MKSNFFNLIRLPQYVLLIFMATTISCCNKDDDNPPPEPVDQLPPATQTGAGTFGCLLDGEVFLPGNNTPNPLDCVYQYVNGGYYFALQSNRRINGSDYQALGIGSNLFQIEEGGTYALKENVPNNVSGHYRLNLDSNYTSEIHTGELKITKLDYDNHIVAGTFWFDVKDSNSVVHEIRNGRFDVRFTE
ncbi:DUF6252 family protein [Aequorivita marina]|uniref:DUF6252 family protein n=1 Tax=Aequorivita marina TaxID=3073654 RepID=UPI0028751908|nr:DUF6252 family protein [Aequorivita sp. S2608]MDS1297512.1 hypothetical protein [Aequorivita sp. S2608]